MVVSSDVPEALLRAERQLLGPGGPFVMETARVLGETVRVFAGRHRSLRALVERSLDHGDRTQSVWSDGVSERRLSFREHAAEVAALAAALWNDHGVRPGDRVALCAPNIPEHPIAFWATVSLGAVATCFNAWWTGDEIAYALGHAEPKVLVVDERRHDRLRSVPRGVRVLRAPRDFPALLRAHRGAGLPTHAIAEDDPAIMLYTSGTTGRPKGVVHTHRNVCALVGTSFFHGARIAMSHPTGPSPSAPSVLVTSPLFHVSGLHCAAVTTLAGGAKSVWPMGRFDAGLALELIERERVTGWGYTSTILRRLLAHPDVARRDLSSLTMIGGGGSPIAPDLQAETREKLPSVRGTLGVGYGLTEGCAFTTLNAASELALHPRSVGRPLPLVDLEVRDAQGRAVAEGEEGEVCMRGALVMKEYFRDAEATAATLGPGRWLRTGDLGRMENGRLYLASRRMDLLLRGGENVYPAEIELRLESHPDVLEAAVVGVDDAELGQVPKAFVVPREGTSVAADALARFVGEALAYYKVPSQWEIRAEPLPKNATGKVLKHVLLGLAESTFVSE